MLADHRVHDASFLDKTLLMWDASTKIRRCAVMMKGCWAYHSGLACSCMSLPWKKTFFSEWPTPTDILVYMYSLNLFDLFPDTSYFAFLRSCCLPVYLALMGAWTMWLIWIEKYQCKLTMIISKRDQLWLSGKVITPSPKKNRRWWMVTVCLFVSPFKGVHHKQSWWQWHDISWRVRFVFFGLFFFRV